MRREGGVGRATSTGERECPRVSERLACCAVMSGAFARGVEVPGPFVDVDTSRCERVLRCQN